MVKKYSVASARAHLSQILDEVESGVEVHVLRRGKPVAVVLSASRHESLRNGRPNFAQAMADFLREHPAEDLALRLEEVKAWRNHEVGRDTGL